MFSLVIGGVSFPSFVEFRMRRSHVRYALLVLGMTAAPLGVRAQQSLAPLSPRGQSVTPAFEGWYKNRDGTFSLSFGYFNRNEKEEVDIPVGTSNFIAPGTPNQGQPTHFAARRHWGVFAVKVPADFGEKKLIWTLSVRGRTYAIPGSLRPDWEIDAVEGEASADNTPPRVTVADGPEAQGPAGSTTAPMTIGVGRPLRLNISVKDDAKAEPIAKSAMPVELTWFLHQGPGAVTFAPPTAKLTPTGGTSMTTATFSTPGDYLLRVRANDSPVVSAGHSQCCWTNAYVAVKVTP